MKPRNRTTLLSAALTAALSGPAMATPNFSGLWQSTGGPYFTPNQIAGKLQNPPYNAQYQARYDKLWQAKLNGKPIGDPTDICQPEGMPRMMIMPRPMEISQIPERTNIYSEWNMTERRIWTDGRPFPDDPDPAYFGYSVGHWDGDTLVAETRALREDTLLDATGLVHSDALIVKERIRMVDRNTLQDEITLEDSKAFTKPWTLTRQYKRAPAGLALKEYVCLDEKNKARR